jgi:hypothetical protein
MGSRNLANQKWNKMSDGGRRRPAAGGGVLILGDRQAKACWDIWLSPREVPFFHISASVHSIRLGLACIYPLSINNHAASSASKWQCWLHTHGRYVSQGRHTLPTFWGWQCLLDYLCFGTCKNNRCSYKHTEMASIQTSRAEAVTPKLGAAYSAYDAAH